MLTPTTGPPGRLDTTTPTRLQSLLSQVGNGGLSHVMGRVSEIFCYPVKSCQGISLASVSTTRQGLMWDRRWVVVDGAGTVQNQFDGLRRLASIQPAFEARSDGEDGMVLVLSAPNMAKNLRIPVDGMGQCRAAEAPTSVTLNRTKLEGSIRVGDGASMWLSTCLGGEYHLMFAPPQTEGRSLRSDSKYGLLYKDGETVAFADTVQYLVTSRTSLQRLNEMVPKGVHIPMDRFRPNIVVDGTPAWAEDTWGSISFYPPSATTFVGSAGGGHVQTADASGKDSYGYNGGGGGDEEAEPSLVLRNVMPALRCLVTTIQQSGPDAGRRQPAESGGTKEPLNTLKEFRKVRDGQRFPGGCVFGIKMNRDELACGNGRISVGDDVQVNSRCAPWTWDAPPCH